MSKLAHILTIIKSDLIILFWYDNFIIPLKLVFFGWEDRRRGHLIGILIILSCRGLL